MDRGVCFEEAHPKEDRMRLILFFFALTLFARSPDGISPGSRRCSHLLHLGIHDENLFAPPPGGKRGDQLRIVDLAA